MDIDAYLARIGIARVPGTSFEDLAVLHRAHTAAVPFENYDIHLGVPISLALDDLQDKLVRRRRGGFCYELNGAFAELLRGLGFDVTLVSAFELSEDGVRGADFDHLRLIVRTTDGPFLADVGNGARWPGPVPMRPGTHGDVRVEVQDGVWQSFERRPDGDGWDRGWAWTTQPRSSGDFVDRCLYQEHDPGSAFVGRRLAVLPVPGGRISLVNGELTEITPAGVTKRELDAEQEQVVLAERFGIVLDRVPALCA